MNTCVVSVAFREPYITHSNRQRDIIIGYNPKVSRFYFIDKLPHGLDEITENIVGHFQKSLYGFKPHAIHQAYLSSVLSGEKFEKMIWLDPSVLPTTPLDALINALDEHPILTITGDATMDKMCNDKALKYFGVTREEAQWIKHVGGTIYGFNFTNPKAVEVFNLWKKAEEDGIFGTQDEFMNHHWADEACFALALYKCNVEQYFPKDFKYANQKEL